MSNKNPYSLREIFETMTMALIASLRRTFIKHKKDELEEGFQWEQWQLVKLRSFQEYRRANKAIIGSFSKEIEDTIQEVLRDSYRKGESHVEQSVKEIVGKVIVPEDFEERTPYTLEEIESFSDNEILEHALDLPKAPREESFFSVNDKKLEALQKTVNDDMKKAQHAIHRKMDDVYRQTIYKAEVHLASGSKTLNQAVDMATKDFLAKGIDCIIYKDGRKVNVSYYAEMALRAANQRATFLGEGKKRDEWGIYTVVMSAHANCSPMCLPYQGTVLIDDVYTSLTEEQAQQLARETKYVRLSEAMRNHAFHPNCRHTLSTYFPGITQLPQPIDNKKAVETYEAEQRQRYMEGRIRMYKRLEAGSLTAENVNKYAAKVKEWQQKLKDHLNEHPELRRDYRRERMTETLEPVPESSILGDRKWLKAPFSTEKRLTKHVEDHASEYGGNITKEEYLNRARDLLAAPIDEDIEGFISEGGFTFKYRNSSNDFAIGRADGKISTIFKPDNKREYWLRQIELHGGKG